MPSIASGVLPVAMALMKGPDRLLKRRCTAIVSRLCFNSQIGDECVSMGGAALLADIVVDFSASDSDKVIQLCVYIYLLLSELNV